VSRTPKGEPAALVVDDENTVQQRLLTLNRAIGNEWLVASGLEAGDRVIVEGRINVRPGAVVRVAPFEAAPAAPQTQDSRRSSEND